MHRGEMPLFIVRYGAAAIRIVTPRGGGSLTFPWRLQQTPGWDQFSGKGRGLFVSGPQIDLFTGSLRQSSRGNEAMLFTKPFVYKTSLFNGIRQTAVMWWRHGRHGFLSHLLSWRSSNAKTGVLFKEGRLGIHCVCRCLCGSWLVCLQLLLNRVCWSLFWNVYGSVHWLAEIIACRNLNNVAGTCFSMMYWIFVSLKLLEKSWPYLSRTLSLSSVVRLKALLASVYVLSLPRLSTEGTEL